MSPSSALAKPRHALDLIDKIVREAACPVIVLLHARDPEFIKEASKRGVFAHISDADVEDWQSSIDIVLRRFAEYHDLQGAFGRRALTERAKGILMERHSIDDATAFEMLRERSRTDNRKLIDLATAIVDGHRLLPKSAGPLRILTARCGAQRRRAADPWREVHCEYRGEWPGAAPRPRRAESEARRTRGMPRSRTCGCVQRRVQPAANSRRRPARRATR